MTTPLRLQEQPEGRFNQFGHGTTLPSCFALQGRQNGIVYVQRGFQMANNALYVNDRPYIQQPRSHKGTGTLFGFAMGKDPPAMIQRRNGRDPKSSLSP